MLRELKFYLLRLKNAPLPELLYRAQQFITISRVRRHLKQSRNPVSIPAIDKEDLKHLIMPDFSSMEDQDRAALILQGETYTLHTKRSLIQKLEEDFSQFFFADIKLPSQSPDIRTVWEPARLQHITFLVKHAETLSDKKTIKEFIKANALKWIRDNPFPYGVHYLSVMECGLRIPVFFYCLKYIEDLAADEYHLILETIYLHAWLTSKLFSLYSSLGNHTIAESIGLIFAGAVFRKTKKGRQWLQKGTDLLRQESTHQIMDDGGPAEQSLNYHRFVLDLYWLAIDFLEKNKLNDLRDIKPRLAKGENFLKSFLDISGALPLIGDSDDGCAIAPSLAPYRPETNKQEVGLSIVEHSGYCIIHSLNNVRVIFDHGPLGMPPLYNHGHADALSITLSKEGKKFLVDPGTYRYNGEPTFRKYFKSTRAHNTVTIDGCDQAVQETGFIWSHPYKTKTLRTTYQNNNFLIEAMHDGYTRLKNPVVHKRTFHFFAASNIIIKDSFAGEGQHDFELLFHLHPDVSVTKDHEWWAINNQGISVFIQLLDDYDFNFIKGQGDPLLGWYSPVYGIKKQSGVLRHVKRGSPHEVSFVTAVCISDPLKPKNLIERLAQLEQQTSDT